MRSGGLAALGITLFSIEGRFATTTTEDLYERSDRTAARATDAVVADIAEERPPVADALHACYLGRAWVRPALVSPLVGEGLELVGRGLARRGIV